MTGFGLGVREELPVATPQLLDRLLSPLTVNCLDPHQLAFLGVDVDLELAAVGTVVAGHAQK